MLQIYPTIKEILLPLFDKLSIHKRSECYQIDQFPDEWEQLQSQSKMLQYEDKSKASPFEIVFKDLLQEKISHLITESNDNVIVQLSNILDFGLICFQKDLASKNFPCHILLKVAKLIPYNQLPKYLEYLMNRIELFINIVESNPLFASDIVRITNVISIRLEGDNYTMSRGECKWLVNSIVDYSHQSGTNGGGTFNSDRRFPPNTQDPFTVKSDSPFFEQPFQVFSRYLAKPLLILDNNQQFEDFQKLLDKALNEIQNTIHSNSQPLKSKQSTKNYPLYKKLLIEVLIILDYLKLLEQKNDQLPSFAQLSSQNSNAVSSFTPDQQDWMKIAERNCFKYLHMMDIKHDKGSKVYKQLILENLRRERFWSQLKRPRTNFNLGSRVEVEADDLYNAELKKKKEAKDKGKDYKVEKPKIIESELRGKKREAIESAAKVKREKFKQSKEPNYSCLLKGENTFNFDHFGKLQNKFPDNNGRLGDEKPIGILAYSKEAEKLKIQLENDDKFYSAVNERFCWKLMRKLRLKNLGICNRNLDMGRDFTVDKVIAGIEKATRKDNGTTTPKEKSQPTTPAPVVVTSSTPKTPPKKTASQSLQTSAPATPKEDPPSNKEA